MNDTHKYEGQFKMGEKHGLGTVTSPDGSVFVGTFKKENMTGQGKYTNVPFGSSYEGKWNYDQM
jgi:hypothetical protein|tara:strand:+ start:588 stop:779 length:192 start_codon:yes stop_codon:yes gene_type:complete